MNILNIHFKLLNVPCENKKRDCKKRLRVKPATTGASACISVAFQQMAA